MITFLGPVGATFSHDAYNVLSHAFGVPSARETECVPAAKNGEILSLILGHGGYGCIAMETRAEGRVAEPLESFMELLQTYETTQECPLGIAGAVMLKLCFCLMVRPDIDLNSISRIIAHPKALGACKARIKELRVSTVEASSNGEAARLVAESDEYVSCAALGPRSAAEKYGLKILSDSFEDREAITTFFLIAPKPYSVVTGEENRLLVVFQVPHEPGSYVRSLVPFAEEGLNLMQVHSVHVENGTYCFAIEVEANNQELAALERAVKKFERRVKKCLIFGPFAVLKRG